MRTVIGSGQGKRREILKGILGHIEIQRFKKCGLGWERSTSIAEDTEARLIWFATKTEFVRSLHKITMNTFGIDRGASNLGGKPFGEPLDGRSLGAKSSTLKCVTEMVTQEYVTRFAMQAAEAEKRR